MKLTIRVEELTCGTFPKYFPAHVQRVITKIGPANKIKENILSEYALFRTHLHAQPLPLTA